MNTTTKWILAVIAAAIVGGGTVALIGNAGKTPIQIPAIQNGQQTKSKKPGCEIKGNINSKGKKIYHMPGQRYYDQTKIDEKAGERWFCTEQEAIDAGWRKSKV